MVSIDNLALPELPDWMSSVVIILLVLALIPRVVAAWSGNNMRAFYGTVADAWDALVLCLRGIFDYPEPPEGRSKWRPLGARQALRAAPLIGMAWLLFGAFSLVATFYIWYGIGNPRLSLGAHAMVIAYLLAAVLFTRAVMVKGFKTWHDLR